MPSPDISRRLTSNLLQRVWQHREGVVDGFTNTYDVKMLVWDEQHESMESAIRREKAMKKWNRAWKLKVIEATNPAWRDLWNDITGVAAEDAVHPEALDSRLRGNDEYCRLRGNDEYCRLRGNDGKT